MLLGGLWHGASLRFVLWGGIHGVALGIHKMAMAVFPGFKAQGIDMNNRFRRILGILITFHLVCFSWIFFRSESMESAWAMLGQIFTSFKGAIFFDFIVGYKWIVLLMSIGYTLHFMPQKAEDRFRDYIARQPMLLNAILITALIWLIMQIKSGEIQPFIYFQF